MKTVLIAAAAAALVAAGVAAAQGYEPYGAPKKPKTWNTFQEPAKIPPIPKIPGPARTPGFRPGDGPSGYVYKPPGVIDPYKAPKPKEPKGSPYQLPCSSRLTPC